MWVMSGRDINGYPRWVNGVNGDGLLLGSPNSKCGSPLRTGFSQCGDPPQPMKHWELLQVVVPPCGPKMRSPADMVGEIQDVYSEDIQTYPAKVPKNI